MLLFFLFIHALSICVSALFVPAVFFVSSRTQANLKKAWEAAQRSTKDDWLEWMRRFSGTLSTARTAVIVATLTDNYQSLQHL